MAMDMKQSYSGPEFQQAWKEETRTILYSVLEINPVLAHNIIHHKCDWYVLHVVREHLAYAIAHIDLSGVEDQDIYV